MATKSQRKGDTMRGGARKGTGPKIGPGGKKIEKSVSLTSDVWKFLVRDSATSGNSIESIVRRTQVFKAWLKTQPERTV